MYIVLEVIKRDAFRQEFLNIFKIDESKRKKTLTYMTIPNAQTSVSLVWLYLLSKSSEGNARSSIAIHLGDPLTFDEVVIVADERILDMPKSASNGSPSSETKMFS